MKISDGFMLAERDDDAWSGSWAEHGAITPARIGEWSGSDFEPSRLQGIGFTIEHGLAFARSTAKDGMIGGSGLVEYRISATDVLEARWVHPSLADQVGTGHANRTSGQQNGFAGTYRIVYRDAAGETFGPPCDLGIERDGTVYRLSWTRAGTDKLLFLGVGAEVEGCLVSAWAPGNEAPDLVVLKFGPDRDLEGRSIIGADGGQRRERYRRVAEVETSAG